MAATLTERTVHALEIVKEEVIAAPAAVVFETVLEQPLSNVQFRLAEEGGGTRLRFVHRAMGQIAHDAQLVQGWSYIEGGWANLIARIEAAAPERARTRHTEGPHAGGPHARSGAS